MSAYPHLYAYLLTLMIALTSCAAPELADQPHTNQFKHFSFDIDKTTVGFDIPSGGSIGEHNSFSVDTSEIDGDFQILFSFGYDLLITRTRWYNVSNLLFGVKKMPVEGIGETSRTSIADQLSTTGKCDFGSNSDPSISEAYTDTDGDFVDHRVLNFDDEYALFFNLRIYSEHVDYPGLIGSRRAMLDRVVSSLVCNDS